MLIWFILLLPLISKVFGVIVDDFPCTSKGVYTSGATACANIHTASACAGYYPEAVPGVVPGPVPGAGWPLAENSVQRPFACYSVFPKGGAVHQNVRQIAISGCPNPCGFCCENAAYNCSNTLAPRLNCNAIAPGRCNSPNWRQIISEDCPAACGFCVNKGCFDAISYCEDYMCSSDFLVQFVNTNCRKTCGKCKVHPTQIKCAKYPADVNPHCASWAGAGFCTNQFYKDVWRTYCATTCKIC